jgi:hypothetical protein
MQVTAEGIVLHGFFGKYVGTIGLSFKHAEHAQAALAQLGEPWKASAKNPCVLVCRASGDAFNGARDALERFNLERTPCGLSHCEHQCREAPIDNVNHSIDRGGNFTVSFEISPPGQLDLIGGST